MVNNPLIRPYFLGGGGIGGVPLDSHDLTMELDGPKISVFARSFGWGEHPLMVTDEFFCLQER